MKFAMNVKDITMKNLMRALWNTNEIVYESIKNI